MFDVWPHFREFHDHKPWTNDDRGEDAKKMKRVKWKFLILSLLIFGINDILRKMMLWGYSGKSFIQKGDFYKNLDLFFLIFYECL